MRRLVFSFIVLFLFLTVVGGALSYNLVKKSPYLPGDALFPVQVISEHIWGEKTIFDKTQRADVLLTVLARRLDEMEAVTGVSAELVAVQYVDAAFASAEAAIAEVPETEQAALQSRLMRLTKRGLSLIDGLAVAQLQPPETAVNQLRTSLKELRQFLSASDSTLAALSAGNPDDAGSDSVSGQGAGLMAALSNELDNPLAVPFPSSPELVAAHSFFPLTGGHNVNCSTCHRSGYYQGTDPTCISCHASDDAHKGSNGTDCVQCHSIENWQDASFDHSTIGTTDCVECHAPPANHFAGACTACHSDTTNFKNALFNHATIGNADCATCHTPPANHFAGACAACHSDTTNFKNALFNHATIGNTDCATCHTPPANHFAGACAACHSDTTNFKNAFFNHATIGNTDCAACHTPPTNHYPGACRNCHVDTNSFGNVSFNHAGLTDCQSCHAAPANHFPGQCSNCHNTSTFSGATFNHTFPINHEGTNGQCANCHPGGNTSTYSCASCHSPQDVANEHNEEGITNTANCISCHADGTEGEHEGGDSGDDDHGDDHHDDDHDDEDDDD